MTQRPIIIDCDPGIDDAIAIFLALASPELKLLGITTVAGNVPLARTQANARRICEVAGRADIKVFAGCPRPLLRPPVTADGFHGASGLGDGGLGDGGLGEGGLGDGGGENGGGGGGGGSDGDTEWPEPAMPLRPAHAVDWIVGTLTAAGEAEITICALGPLTNLAVAIVKTPAILPKIREIIMMGGSLFRGGNVTPAAEYNIYADPHAAQVVFTCGRPLTLIPLDVTHQAMVTAERLDRLAANPGAVGRACRSLLSFYRRQHAKGRDNGDCPLHDPCVIAYLLAPDLFGGRQVHVAVETTSETALGMTLADWRGVTGQPPNCTAMTEIDAPAVFDLLSERIGGL